jgi:ABC-2 type transport system permease protein
MIADVVTVMWKDARELLFGGGTRRGWLSLLIIIGVFGIFLPLQFGPEWVATPLMLVYWAWIPLFMVSSSVSDSFAGERERHTLETLLASRLSDRAILFGKFCTAVFYGWGLTVVSLLVGLVTINVAHGRGELLLYPAPIFWGAVVMSLLMSGLTASIGVLVSLRAATVQQAAQRMSLGVMIVVFAPILIVQVLPAEWQARIGQALQNTDFTGLAVIVVAILVALNALFLTAAMARFRRARLILD